ncbi:hypothetical protein MM35RIKEN_01560 [Vescimonas fastidiosa]|uniref:Gram-positive cocci surface proteins LPxTG domain-containing protein n=1 Tax=Vescimonas fastidiosa TaxID=2714353 RepID=A0A810PPQ0_9FIRM|nr:hypothetical protein [Vescimonas fastidiosa]BCK77964.1 hypothetical protein MM35RIKEN_01560 [Vescimonas fastidiosa]
MKKLIASILIVLLMIPTVAFAESTHTLSELDLTASGHSDKTLENDGYTWDAANAVLTLKDISVGGDVILPKKDCTINVQGECYAGKIWRNDSGAAQSTTINGSDGAKLWAEIEVSGALTLHKLTMTDGEIRNQTPGPYPNYILTLHDSAINLRSLSWMPNAGIDLHSSKLHVVMAMPDSMPQFWVEKITMDEKSEIVSDTRLINYGLCDLADFGNVLNYVAEPVGGRFFKQPGEAVTIVTEVQGELSKADHFVLRAPTGGGEEIPGDGGSEAGPGGTTGGTTDTGTSGGAQAGSGEKAPATGDGGLLLYGGAALLSMSAAAVLLSRKKRER